MSGAGHKKGSTSVEFGSVTWATQEDVGALSARKLGPPLRYT